MPDSLTMLLDNFCQWGYGTKSPNMHMGTGQKTIVGNLKMPKDTIHFSPSNVYNLQIPIAIRDNTAYVMPLSGGRLSTESNRSLDDLFVTLCYALLLAMRAQWNAGLDSSERALKRIQSKEPMVQPYGIDFVSSSGPTMSTADWPYRAKYPDPKKVNTDFMLMAMGNAGAGSFSRDGLELANGINALNDIVSAFLGRNSKLTSNQKPLKTTASKLKKEDALTKYADKVLTQERERKSEELRAKVQPEESAKISSATTASNDTINMAMIAIKVEIRPIIAHKNIYAEDSDFLLAEEGDTVRLLIDTIFKNGVRHSTSMHLWEFKELMKQKNDTVK